MTSCSPRFPHPTAELSSNLDFHQEQARRKLLFQRVYIGSESDWTFQIRNFEFISSFWNENGKTHLNFMMEAISLKNNVQNENWLCFFCVINVKFLIKKWYYLNFYFALFFLCGIQTYLSLMWAFLHFLISRMEDQCCPTFVSSL